MVLFKIIFFMICQLNSAGPYDNIFESKDYVVILRISSIYGSYKLKLEKAIETKRFDQIKKSTLNEIEETNKKTIEKLSSIYQSIKKNEIKSQIYQIKFELEQSNQLIEKAKTNINKKSKFKEILYKLEYDTYRMEIYLKGLSMNLSLL